MSKTWDFEQLFHNVEISAQNTGNLPSKVLKTRTYLNTLRNLFLSWFINYLEYRILNIAVSSKSGAKKFWILQFYHLKKYHMLTYGKFTNDLNL